MDTELQLLIHAGLMAAALLSMTLGILISLLWKDKKWRYKTHRALGGFAGFVGFIGLVVGVVMVQLKGGPHMVSRHAFFGTIAAFFLIVAPLVALQYRKRTGRIVHKLMGWAALGLGGFSAYLGLKLAGYDVLIRGETPVVSEAEKTSEEGATSEGSVRSNGIRFDWVIKDGYLDGTLKAETTGWIAVGFNPDRMMMRGADFVIGYVENGEAYIRDDFGNSPITHVADTALEGRNDVEVLGGEEIGGVTTVRFRKPLESDDPNDQSFSAGDTMTVIFAYGNQDSFSSMHRGTGKAIITF
ncbi:MAG: hypothetical protein JXR40_10475 [Pontiellaceae bacterium]|nr:hypothetical protein [Pontiellaceae bacterium]